MPHKTKAARAAYMVKYRADKKAARNPAFKVGPVDKRKPLGEIVAQWAEKERLNGSDWAIARATIPNP